jgi:hypothetical protein
MFLGLLPDDTQAGWAARLQTSRAVYTALRARYVIDPAAQAAAEVDLRVHNPLSQADDVRPPCLCLTPVPIHSCSLPAPLPLCLACGPPCPRRLTRGWVVVAEPLEALL